VFRGGGAARMALVHQRTARTQHALDIHHKSRPPVELLAVRPQRVVGAPEHLRVLQHLGAWAGSAARAHTQGVARRRAQPPAARLRQQRTQRKEAS
jgi:hypothetical protein